LRWAERSQADRARRRNAVTAQASVRGTHLHAQASAQTRSTRRDRTWGLAGTPLQLQARAELVARSGRWSACWARP
jgi:hypothetical protein